MAPKRRVASSSPAPPASSSPSQTPNEPSKAASSSTTTASSTAPVTFTAKSPPQEIVLGIWQRYIAQTPQRTLLLDAFMGFLVVVGVLQFVYCVLAGNYPFNAFLSGFSAAVGQFVLTASLRMQTTESEPAKPGSKQRNTADQELGGVSSERAFADYVFGSVILHFFCINFIN